MNNAVNNIKRNIDTRIVVSVVVASFVTGVIVLGLQKAGMRQIANIAK